MFVEVYGVVARVLSVLYTQKMVLFYGLRVVMGIWSAVCEATFFRAVAVATDGVTAIILLLFMAVAPGFFVASTSTRRGSVDSERAPLAALVARAASEGGSRQTGLHSATHTALTSSMRARTVPDAGMLPSSFCMPLVMLAYAGWLQASHAARPAEARAGRTQAIVAIAVAALLGWPFAAAIGAPIAVDLLLVRGEWSHFLRTAILAGVGILVRRLSDGRGPDKGDGEGAGMGTGMGKGRGGGRGGDTAGMGKGLGWRSGGAALKETWLESSGRSFLSACPPDAF